jgi:hypothetical protein
MRLAHEPQQVFLQPCGLHAFGRALGATRARASLLVASSCCARYADTVQRQKVQLFYTFLFVYVATFLLTFLGVLDVVKIREGYLTALVSAVLIESVGAVVLLFKQADFFKPLPLDTPPPQKLLPSDPPSVDHHKKETRRPEIEERILVYVNGRQRAQPGNFSLDMKVNATLALHHFEELESAGLIKRGPVPDSVHFYVTPEGRAYLVRNSLFES